MTAIGREHLPQDVGMSFLWPGPLGQLEALTFPCLEAFEVELVTVQARVRIVFHLEPHLTTSHWLPTEGACLTGAGATEGPIRGP